MTEAEAKKVCKELIMNAPIVILSTLNEEGYPESRAMLNLSKLNDNDDFQIWFTTNTSSRKIKQIRENNKATAYFTVHQNWKGVLLEGAISIVEDLETKKKIWEPSWAMYYPQGPADPDYAVLVLKPERARVYGDLSKISFKI